jgi:hypothetical protein
MKLMTQFAFQVVIFACLVCIFRFAEHLHGTVETAKMRMRGNLVNSPRLRWTLGINCTQRGSDLPFRDTLVLLFSQDFFLRDEK